MALATCLSCMVAPPGFAVATVYKQYTCVGQALSASPSAFPSAAPVSLTITAPVSPTLEVTWSPTYAAGNVPGAVAVATVNVVQSFSSLSLTTANTPAFQTTFIQTTASQLGVLTSAISSLTITGSRRRNLLAVSIAYTVTATNTNPTILANLIQSNSAALGQALTANGYQIGTVSTQATPVVAAAPVSSPSSTSTSACFAGTELVTLESGETKSLTQVKVGDRVLTMSAKSGKMVFSDIAYLPHGSNTKSTTFVKITTTSGRDLKMTMNHMIPVGTCDTKQSLTYLPASEIVVGDCVETVNGREPIVSAESTEGKGIYTLIAMEELLVINGIIATPFGGINPTLANIYYNLHGLFYSLLGSSVLTVHELLQKRMELVWSVMSEL